MKSTTRGTLAAVITGAEDSLGMELPEIGADVPLPLPGTPGGPR